MEVRELVEEIVKALVDMPDEVQCTEIQGTNSCVLARRVAILLQQVLLENLGLVILIWCINNGKVELIMWKVLLANATPENIMAATS